MDEGLMRDAIHSWLQSGCSSLPWYYTPPPPPGQVFTPNTIHPSVQIDALAVRRYIENLEGYLVKLALVAVRNA